MQQLFNSINEIMENFENEKAKKAKTRSRIKEYVSKAASSSTTHGIDRILNTNRNILRILWITFFLASTATCGYFIGNTIMDFLEFNVVTKIQTIYEVPQLFPTVSVCNLNIFNNNQSIEFALKSLKTIGIQDAWGQTDTSIGFNMTPIIRTILMKYLTSASFKEPNITIADLKYYGIKYEDFILSCTFNFQPCNSSTFEWYFDAKFGSCFKFNGQNSSNWPLYSYQPGMINGLSIELYIAPITNPYAFSLDLGAYVSIQNASETVTNIDGIKTQVGSATNIIVT